MPCSLQLVDKVVFVHFFVSVSSALKSHRHPRRMLLGIIIFTEKVFCCFTFLLKNYGLFLLQSQKVDAENK